MKLSGFSLCASLGLSATFTIAAMPSLNLLGFTPESEKLIVIAGSDANPLEVRNLSTGKTVFTQDAPYVYEWEASGEEVQTFDISKIKTPGTYRLYRAGEALGTPFQIGEKVYEPLVKAALKWFYYQRAGLVLESQYADKWARNSGHPDTLVKVFGDTTRVIRAPKGWYDAGDYGKYIVNSGITVFTLLDFYENYSAFADTLSLNIPREYKKLPEILEEVRWNLDWMLAMQDQDGSVFHKLTSLKFCGSVMPEQDGAARYAIGKGIAAALDFAGVMAQASVIYKKFDTKYAETLKKAAERAYAWAKKNPKNFYHQPQGVETGSYEPGTEDGADEFRFAAAELYRATAKKDYLNDLKKNAFTPNGPWWGDVNFLAVYRVAADKKTYGNLAEQAKKILLNEANALRSEADSSGYRLPMHTWNWNWGSNSAVANNGIILLHAYHLTKDRSYLNAAQKALDYLLGKNPFQMSYVTGFGARSPQNPHHRPSEADFVDEAVPGMLVGGPHLGKQDIGEENWKCDDYAKANKPALAYVDDRCSYATNEVAINWNAPLAYLAGALQAIYESKK